MRSRLIRNQNEQYAGICRGYCSVTAHLQSATFYILNIDYFRKKNMVVINLKLSVFKNMNDFARIDVSKRDASR